MAYYIAKTSTGRVNSSVCHQSSLTMMITRNDTSSNCYEP